MQGCSHLLQENLSQAISIILRGVQGLAEDNEGDLTAMEVKEGEAGKLKPAKLCRGFKQMYAKPSKKDPAHRTSPQEQV